MNKANDIKTLIEQHDWVAARAALDSVPADSMAQSERLFLEGLLAAKQADWHKAKGYFLRADELAPHGEAAEMLNMITDIYDFYYKDNLNP
jgi:hypothetical protein